MRYKIKENIYSLKIIGIIILSLSLILMMFSTINNDLTILVTDAVFFVIGIYILLISKRCKIFLNPIYLFPFTGIIYAISYPLFNYITTLAKVNNDYSYFIVYKGTLFNIIFVVILSLLIAIFYKDNHSDLQSFKKVFEYHRTKINMFIEIFMWIFLFVVFRVYMKNGLANAAYSGTVRADILSSFDSIPYYSYLCYIFIACSIYSLISFFNTKSKLNKAKHVPIILCIAIFYYIQMKIGNRREFLYLLLCLYAFLVFKNQGKVKIKNIVGVVLIFLFFIFIGVSRTFTNLANVKQNMLIYTIFGEFITPTNVLYFYLEHPKKLLFGFSYLNLIFNIIPKFIWPSKPSSLAIQFMKDSNLTFGYAFTPQCEAYLNFGIIGLIICPILVYIFVSYICKRKSRHPYLYFALYTQVFNFFRSEIASSVTEVIIIAATLYILNKINHIKQIQYKEN